MATALVKEGCSVCHEAFKEPKILPCGHVVCRPCLLSWLRAQPQAGCPLCRCTVLETEGQPGSLEEEVGALPTDLALAELVEARALLDKDHTCCVCEEDVAATAICLHCRDMMCASCTKAHRKMSMSKHHKVKDLVSLTPDSLADSRPPACSSHPDEQCRLFCAIHGLSVCVLCATAMHRTCPDLQDLEEKTEEARATLKQMAVSLTAKESELKGAILRLERHIENTEERVQAAVSHIQKTCDQLEACVQSCRSHMTDLAHKAGSDIKTKARESISILQDQKCHVTSHALVVTRAEGSKAFATVSKMSEVMRTRVKQLDCDVTQQAIGALIKMAFSIDVGIVSTVERKLAALGQVKFVPPNPLAFSPAGEFTFHQERGANVVLSEDRKTATRQEGNGRGLVASTTRLEINVLYEVRLDEWKTGWSLAMGVLTGSLDCVNMTSGMSQHLRPVAAINKTGVKTIGTMKYKDHPLSSVMEKLRKKDRVGVSLDSSCDLHLHVNGEDLGVWGPPVISPCRVLLELMLKSQVTALRPTRLD